MPYRTHKDKPDGNLKEIREAAHSMGALTCRWRLVDLVVIYRGDIQLWEVKMPGKDLRAEQKRLFRKMSLYGYTPKIIRTIEDVAEALGGMG